MTRTQGCRVQPILAFGTIDRASMAELSELRWRLGGRRLCLMGSRVAGRSVCGWRVFKVDLAGARVNRVVVGACRVVGIERRRLVRGPPQERG